MPELNLRIRVDHRDHAAAPADRDDDVTVVVDPTHTVAELTAALGDHLGAPLAELWSERHGARLDPATAVDRVGLVSGDVLAASPALLGPPPPRHDGPLVAVDVVAGPDSGRTHLVRPPGRYTIGRSAASAIVVDDPSVSREHAAIELDRTGAVILHPVPDAPNGTWIGADEIRAPSSVAATDVVGVGGTRLVIRPVAPRPGDRHDRLGQIDFHRTPYRPPVVAERDVAAVGPVPERPEPRRFQLLAVLAPLAAGLLMYAFSRQVQFLALTLISPIVVIGTVIDERRSGRRTARERVARFRTDLVERRRRFEQLRAEERVERFRTAPDLADLIRRAELRSIDLWPRGRTAPDFLSVRLGLGSATVRFPIELERGGADDLRAEALEALAGLDELADVPVTVDLAHDAVLGVHGDADLVTGVAASLAVQSAVLHSPEDLTIAAAVAPGRPLDWLKWLPHARSVVSPLSGNHVVHTTEASDQLVARLLDVVAFRHVDGRDRDAHRVWPRVLVLVDAALRPDPAAMSRLLDAAPVAGIGVVWLAGSAAEVPRQAGCTLEVRRGAGGAMRGRLWSTDPELADRELEVEHLRAELADRAARALAPVRDASTSSLATSIPRTAPLLDVLGVGRPSPTWVSEHWIGDRAHHLRFPLGIGADGPIVLDLVEDGPHTLIGGTSGAGKSELLQSMVAALAVHHPPTRLNFLFVDYKGGASSKVFERLPHTVGYVTNLGADLAVRALTSLRAELNRRMAILEGRAKDLAEMLEVAPDEAPPSLAIVVDEFATLVTEVPEFVAGVIDIAQRGRSLGIHLVLATQRPSGSVNENILANTNLRISLRMLDRAESTSIVGSPDAADIPVPLRGRGLLRLGPCRLVEFQSAYAGAPLQAGEMRPPVLVGGFHATDDSPRGPAAVAADGPTHLAVVLDAIVAANERLGLPTPRAPWREVLPDVVTLDDVLADGDAAAAFGDPGRFVAIGMLDDPEHQDQRPALLDLEDGGGCLVFGSGGSGKTTLLRTVAAAIGATARPGRVEMFVLDMASRGLGSLAALPVVVEVATGDDLEAVTRTLLVLDAELDRRRRLLAAAAVEHLSAYHRDRREHDLPRIVVLVDGFGGLSGALFDASSPGGDEWMERVLRLVTDGRQVGIHTVITADRRNAVPTRLHAAVANRLVLRHADEASYAEHGIAGRDLPALAPGRGLLQGTVLVQIASVAGDPSARAQGAAIAALAGSLGPRAAASTLASAPLADELAPTPLAPGVAGRLTASIGRADVTGGAVTVDLAWSHATVCGPARSGRSTALAVIVGSLLGHRSDADPDIAVVGPSSSPLRCFGGVAGVRATFGRPDVVAPDLDRLANQLAMGAPDDPARVLVVDDADTFDDLALAAVLERLCRFDGLRLVAAVETRSMAGYTASPLVNLARRARRLLVLRPDDPGEFLQVTGVKLAVRPGLRLPAGRGVLLTDRVPEVVQVASVVPVAPTPAVAARVAPGPRTGV